MAKGYDIILRWDGQKLVPAADTDRWALREAPADSLFEARRWRPKSPKAMRKLHAMLRVGEDNSFGWTSEAIKSQVKLAHGWVTGARVEKDGAVFCELRSLSDFTQDELGLFIAQAREFLLKEVVPGLDPRLLDREIENETAERRR